MPRVSIADILRAAALAGLLLAACERPAAKDGAPTGAAIPTFSVNERS